MVTCDLRAETDHLQGGEAKARFWAKGRIDDGRGYDPILARAITMARTGDPEGMRYLYVRYGDNVYGYVRSIVRDAHEAEDITQQLFVKLMTALDKYEPRGVPFSAWMLRLAHNLAMDHMRAPLRRITPCEEVRSADEPDDGHEERQRCLRTALQSLPDEQRNVILLRHVAGLSPGEIAEHMGRSESSVHGLHHRGRRALQSHLRLLDSAPATVSAQS
ncbi:MAG: RNA polymerase sigma factor [Solirubrobacteraceae bacterium]